MVTVRMSENGIDRVFAESKTVAEGKLDARVIEAAMLGLRLVHESIKESFNSPAGALWTYRDDLIDEITVICDGSALRATQLVEHLGWDLWRASSYEELKKTIVDTRETGRRVDPSMHEDFLMTIGVFYRQLRIDGRE